jgi:hypothetical protein
MEPRMSTFTSDAEIEKMVRAAICVFAEDEEHWIRARKWLDQRIAGYDASKAHFARMVGVLSGLDLHKHPTIELPDLSEEPPPIEDSGVEEGRPVRPQPTL